MTISFTCAALLHSLVLDLLDMHPFPHETFREHCSVVLEQETSPHLPEIEIPELKCKEHRSIAKLPARDSKCAGRPLFARYCVSYQYTYECVMSR